MRRVFKVLSWQAAPLIVLLSLWLPILCHYHVLDVDVTAAAIDRSRDLPADATLEELRSYAYLESRVPDRDCVPVAEEILRGTLSLPGYDRVQFTFPFDKRDMEKGPSTWQLEWASLIVPRLLLGAYERTGQERFLIAARDVLLGWAAYERSAWLPSGYLWNDHAVAARIPVLAEFWRVYRHHPKYDQSVAEQILRFTARTVEALEKPSQFTFRTNHGIMQNLALLHYAVAFPALPGTQDAVELAVRRLDDQLTFYVGDEGIVLEHSAGYHVFGIKLLGMGLRYLTLLHKPIPLHWTSKYDRAKAYYAKLRRPDGSLPLYGDTDGGPDLLGPAVTEVVNQGASALQYKSFPVPECSRVIYPAAGYAVWWDGSDNCDDLGGRTQTAVTWSYLPGFGHKHADEMSMLIWARGQSWITNVGYWPYWQEGRSDAESWDGSNAPHLLREPATSERNSKLLAYGSSRRIGFLDLQRLGPGRYIAKRQIVRVAPEIWLVIDHTEGGEPGSRTITTWTAAHDLAVVPDGQFGRLRLAGKRDVMSVSFHGSSNLTITPIYGSLNPFAGWEVVHHEPRSAPAFIIEQPADSWSATLFVLNHRTWQGVLAPRMVSWHDDNRWQFMIPWKSGAIEIVREGNRLSILAPGMAPEHLALNASPDDSERYRLLDAFVRSSRKYPIFHDYFAYRSRLSFAILIGWVLLEAALVVYRRLRNSGYLAIRVAIVAGWVAFGIWANCFYL